jgi:hypothetical protein
VLFTVAPDPDTPAGPYMQGDTPPGISAALLDEDGDELDVSTLVTVSGVVVAPAGTSLALLNVTADDLANRVTWDWPVDPFTAPGLHMVELDLTGPGGVALTSEPLPVVAEAVDGWLTMFLLLGSARSACESYAPVLAADENPPEHYLQAQLVQARSVWNLMQTGPQTVDAIGLDAYAVRVYPLDYNVRQLLRPKSGKPVMW